MAYLISIRKNPNPDESRRAKDAKKLITGGSLYSHEVDWDDWMQAHGGFVGACHHAAQSFSALVIIPEIRMFIGKGQYQLIKEFQALGKGVYVFDRRNIKKVVGARISNEESWKSKYGEMICS